MKNDLNMMPQSMKKVKKKIKEKKSLPGGSSVRFSVREINPNK